MNKTIRRALALALTLIAVSAFATCSASPTAPATSDFQSPTSSAQTANDSCSKVDGLWVCSDTTSTTSGTTKPSPSDPICYLDQGVWICVGS